MKTPSFLHASFFFLLVAFGTTARDVFDSDYEPVYNGGAYYLKTEKPYSGHGILAAAIRHGESNECSLVVVTGPSSNGWVTRIRTLRKPTFLFADTPAHIAFNYLAPNVCTNSTRWIVRRLPSSEKQVVMLADSEHALQSSIFKVVPYGTEINTYKLVYCGNSDECENIGLDNSEHTYKPLVVTKGEPLKFKFVKAFESVITSHLSMVV